MKDCDGLAIQKGVVFSDEDIVEAMRGIPGYIDVTPGDFKVIFSKAYEQACDKILHDAKAASIMSAPAVCIGQERSLAELVALLAGHGISGAPVLDEGGRVVGVVSEKDVLRRLGRNPELSLIRLVTASLDEPFFVTDEQRGTSVKGLMSAPPVTAGPDAALGELLALFQKKPINRLPVVDKDMGPLGVISRQDVIKAFGRLL